MAFYYKRPDTKRVSWVVKYRDASGITRSQTCATEAAAKTLRAEKELEELRGARPQAGTKKAEQARARMTVAEFARKEFLPNIQRIRKPGTHETYERVFETYLLPLPMGTRTLGQLRLDQVLDVDLERALGAKLQPRGEELDGRLKPRTILLLIGALGSMFTLARRQKLVRDNPAHDLRDTLGLSDRITEERDDDRHALTEEQQARLRDALPTASPLMASFVAIGLNTGCRIGEILALRWQDVDAHARELHVGWTLSGATKRRRTVRQRLGRAKSGRSRRVQMSAELIAIMRQLRVRAEARALRAGRPFDSADFVLVNEDGQPFTQGNVRNQFRRLLRCAKVPEHFTPHVLRHTFAVELLKQGTPINLVQAQLGHRSITMTMDLYGRWVPSSDRSWIDRLGARMQVSEAVKQRIAAGAEPTHGWHDKSQVSHRSSRGAARSLLFGRNVAPGGFVGYETHN